MRSLDESASLHPLTPYAESKVERRKACVSSGRRLLAGVDAQRHGLRSISCLRLDVVLNNLVAWAHTTGSIRMQSDGTPWRPLVHVRDVARAALALLTAPAARGRRGVQRWIR